MGQKQYMAPKAYCSYTVCVQKFIPFRQTFFPIYVHIHWLSQMFKQGDFQKPLKKFLKQIERMHFKILNRCKNSFVCNSLAYPRVNV